MDKPTDPLPEPWEWYYPPVNSKSHIQEDERPCSYPRLRLPE